MDILQKLQQNLEKQNTPQKSLLNKTNKIQQKISKVNYNEDQNDKERIRERLDEMIKDRNQKMMKESIEVNFAQTINEITSGSPLKPQKPNKKYKLTIEQVKIYQTLKKLELKSKSHFKLNEQKRNKGVNHRRFTDIIENEKDHLLGIFSSNKLITEFSGQSGQKIFDMHKLDFVQLKFKEDIARITQDMIDQAQQSQFGKEIIQKSELYQHKYIPDIAQTFEQKIQQYNSEITNNYQYDESPHPQAQTYDDFQSVARIYNNASIIKVNITGEYPTLYYTFENVNDSLQIQRVKSKNNLIGKGVQQIAEPSNSLVSKISKGLARQLKTEFTTIENRYLKNIEREVVKEYELEDEDEMFQSMYLNYIGMGGLNDNLESSNGLSHIQSPTTGIIEGLGGMIGGLQGFQKGRNHNQLEISDDSDKDLQFIDLIGLSGNNNNNRMHMDNQINGNNMLIITPFENILFYDELLDEESYDAQLIDELFNGQKKIKISKEVADRSRGRSIAALMSRINTENLDDSDSSIQDNQTYQALQKYQFNQILKGNESPDILLRDNRNYTTIQRQKTTRKSVKRQKIDISSIVEFFDPIRKKKGPLSKKNKTGRIKDKGSTQKHGIVNKRVPTDNSTQIEHGLITFYGNVSKQRFRFNSFHLRWMMMRGLNLYWYRSPMDKQQKGNIIIPSVNIQHMRVGQNGRQLRFLDNEQNLEFKHKVSNMIQYKMYVETVNKRDQERLDIQILDFFKDSNTLKLEFHDKQLNDEFKIIYLLESLQAHSRLTQLILVNCGLTDEYLDLLLNKICQRRNTIWHMDFSQNELTQHSIPSLCQYMKHDYGLYLKSLQLNRNTIYDGGLQNLAVGLFDRYQIFENKNQSITKAPIPIQNLGLSDTKFTDNRDFENLMELDISKNNITESSLKYLGDILKKFNGFKSINMQSMGKMKTENGWIDFCRSLRDSGALQMIDLSKNAFSGQVLQELFHAIAENYVISEIYVEIKGKTIPFGFSNNTLMSMYQICLTKENVDL
ncbi:UNKNOWN [Stylonychia lemnae]|uniref:Leucine Rich Repeat family protein n=1 Tax=Stylonychia lemnae TaxID=5949 RepID=A0A077ZP19_STYLE|nr:UNKNOWN [Stylonychia lemnae]|eukprot:CDW71712.1 UNKNOWN [Stylonychia lemnae]